jgi:hypothetical protein
MVLPELLTQQANSQDLTQSTRVLPPINVGLAITQPEHMFYTPHSLPRADHMLVTFWRWRADSP